MRTRLSLLETPDRGAARRLTCFLAAGFVALKRLVGVVLELGGLWNRSIRPPAGSLTMRMSSLSASLFMRDWHLTSAARPALIAAALVLFTVPSLAQAQCNRGSSGMSSGMGGPGMGGDMAMGTGTRMNPMMMQQQLQAMQTQMMQMQLVQQAMLERMEQMSGQTLNVNGSKRRSSVRTTNSSHKKSSTSKRTHRSSEPKSTPPADDSPNLAANERPARSLRPASE
jgi:hypothetical protein